MEWEPECHIFVDQHIELDLPSIIAGGFPWDYIDQRTPTYEGIYGHEQRHVRNTIVAALAATDAIRPVTDAQYPVDICPDIVFSEIASWDDHSGNLIDEPIDDPPGTGLSYPPHGTMPRPPSH
jgi:hypothetical protein